MEKAKTLYKIAYEVESLSDNSNRMHKALDILSQMLLDEARKGNFYTIINLKGFSETYMKGEDISNLFKILLEKEGFDVVPKFGSDSDMIISWI